MSVLQSGKRLAQQVLANSTVNHSVRFILGPRIVRDLVPDNILKRIPVKGEFEASISDASKFWMVTDGNDSIANRIYWRGVQGLEPTTFPVFKHLLAGARNFVDIGANVGFYSLCAAAVNPDLQIFSFEPVPAVAAALGRNVKRNSFTNVTIHASAVTDFDGSLTFKLPQQQTLPTASTSSNNDLFIPSRIISVPAVRLDTALPESIHGSIDLMKVDAETTEPAVLRGAQMILDKSLPTMICEILTDEVGSTVQNLISPRGYEFYHISGTGPRKTETIIADPTGLEQNYLLIVPERKQELLKRNSAESIEQLFRADFAEPMRYHDR